MRLIEENRAKLNLLCEKFHVAKLYLFGSFVKGDFEEDSDIDFLVKFEPFDLYYYFDNYMDLKDSLKELFNKEIDLVEEQSLRNPVLIRSINKYKELVYG